MIVKYESHIYWNRLDTSEYLCCIINHHVLPKPVETSFLLVKPCTMPLPLSDRTPTLPSFVCSCIFQTLNISETTFSSTLVACCQWLDIEDQTFSKVCPDLVEQQ